MFFTTEINGNKQKKRKLNFHTDSTDIIENYGYFFPVKYVRYVVFDVNYI